MHLALEADSRAGFRSGGRRLGHAVEVGGVLEGAPHLALVDVIDMEIGVESRLEIPGLIVGVLDGQLQALLQRQSSTSGTIADLQ